MAEAWALEELQQVANDAGQPELVYKLMELSTSSAVWNTRKGVAFALAAYQRTLIPDQSKFDRVMRNQANFTPQENNGFGAFRSVFEGYAEPKGASEPE